MVIDSGDTGRGVAVSGTRASLEVASAYFVSCRRLVSEDVRDFFARLEKDGDGLASITAHLGLRDRWTVDKRV